MKKSLFSLFLMSFIFIGSSAGVSINRTSFASNFSHWGLTEIKTYITPCPVNDDILKNLNASNAELLNWNQPDGDYKTFKCLAPDKRNCAFGISRWGRQCVINPQAPAKEKVLNQNCVKVVKLWKLKLLTEQGVCKTPAIWQTYGQALGTGNVLSGGVEHNGETITDPDRLVNTEEKQQIEKTGEEISRNTMIAKSSSVSNARKIVSSQKAKTIDTHADKDKEKIKNTHKGDPVDLSRGSFVYQNTLISLQLPKGQNFDLTMHYDNQAEYDGPFGYNRTHNRNQYLSFEQDKIWYYNGSFEAFEFVKNGQKRTNTNDMEIEKQDKSYLIRNTKTKQERSFAQQAEDIKIWRIVSYKDKYLNYDFTYDNIGYLQNIELTNGKKVNFSYESRGEFQQKTIKSVKVQEQHVFFDYYSNYEDDGLEFDIKTIQIARGSESRALKFAYDTHVEYVYDKDGNLIDIIVYDKISHNIKSLIDAESQEYVQNIYDANDRVQSQKYGKYSLSYSYETDGGKIKKTTASNRKGETSIYTYDKNGKLVKLEEKTQNKTWKIKYNQYGQKISEELPDLTAIKYDYDVNGNLISQAKYENTSSVDLIKQTKISYKYDDQDNLISIKSPDGLERRFVYDSNRNVISSKVLSRKINGLRKSLKTEYTYNQYDQLISKTYPDSQVERYIYDTRGNILEIKQTGSSGSTIVEKIRKYEYDDHGNIVKSTDPNGNITRYKYNKRNQILRQTSTENIVQEYRYDKNNNLIQSQTLLENGEHSINKFSYNVLDKLIKLESTQDVNNTSIIEQEYDENDNLKSQQLRTKAKRNYEYDSLQRIARKHTSLQTSDGVQKIEYKYEYDISSNIVKSTDPNGNITRYQYNKSNQLTRLTNAQGTYTKFEYDERGKLLRKKIFNKTHKLLALEEYKYNQRNQIVKESKKDTHKNIEISQETSYDKYLRIVKKTEIDKSFSQYTYDAFARLSSIKDSLGNLITYSYDKNNNLLRQTIEPANSKTQKQYISYTYDKDNRLIGEINHIGQASHYVYNNLNQIISITDANGSKTYYDYDHHGNIKTKTQNDGTNQIITSYKYDQAGQILEQKDAKNNISSYTYDALGRLTSITLPDGASSDYVYDKNDNIIKIKDPNGNIIQNRYNNLDQLIRRDIHTAQTNKGIKLEEYIYDELGRITKIDNDHHTTAIFSYDMLGNMTQERNNAQNIYYNYNNNNQISTISYPSKSKLDYKYDQAGRIKTLFFGGKNISSSYYDSINKIQDILGNGVRTSYVYDKFSRLSKLVHHEFKNPRLVRLNKNISYHYKYDNLNNITDTSKQRYTYDKLSQLKKAEYKINKIDQRDKTALTQNYNYDKLGNRTTDHDEAFAASINHGLDEIRLGYSSTWGNHFGHGTSFRKKYEHGKRGIGDQAIFNKTNSKYTTNNRNQYTKINSSMTGSITNQSACWFSHHNCHEAIDRSYSFTYKYDDNGNLIEDNKRKYSYDYRNRLIETRLKQVDLEEDGQVYKITYRYDNLNRRTEKKIYKTGKKLDLKTIRYTYSHQSVIREESSYTLHPRWNHEKEFIYHPQQLDKIIFSTLTKMGWTALQSTQRFYYHHDHQGSVIAISDQNKNIVQKYIYDARGNIISTETNKLYDLKLPRIKAGLQNTKLYNGRDYEPELGLYYYRHRYYNPTQGRFINQDPLLYVDGPNPYSYVNNNPVNYVDPWGLEKEVLLGKYGKDASERILKFFQYYRDLETKRRNELQLKYYYSYKKYEHDAIITNFGAIAGNNVIYYRDYMFQFARETLYGPGNLKIVKQSKLDDIAFKDASGSYYLMFNGHNIYLSAIGNVLYAYRGYYANISYFEIEGHAFLPTLQKAKKESGSGNLGARWGWAVKNEKSDRPKYRLGYSVAEEMGNKDIGKNQLNSILHALVKFKLDNIEHSSILDY